MTSESRFERQLPTFLEDLYLGPSPDYRDEVLAAATRNRQRPAWTFPGRWLPMADIATRPTLVPRLPWRTIGVALVIIALLAVAAFAIVGSRQTKLPPPFGNAGNGLVAYSSDGDIYTVDPRTGLTRAIVTGPEVDGQPEYSPDGTKVVFYRQSGAVSCCRYYEVVVAASDGSGARVISGNHLVTDDDFAQWSPDGTAILVGIATGSLLRLDASGTAAPVIVAEGVRFVAGEARPPDGAQILYEPDSTPEIDLWIMNADGTGARPLLPATALSGSQLELGVVRWSPDGQMVAFTCASPTNVDVSHICVMNADGTDIRQLTDESDAWFQTDLLWSPDSTKIAFNRWHTDAGGTTTVQPIGVASITGGAVIDAGPAPAPEGALFNWSPDGTTLLSLPAQLLHSPSGAASVRPLAIDVATGNFRQVDWEVRGEGSWQRVAE
jgi:Tol biopolymer transport system component